MHKLKQTFLRAPRRSIVALLLACFLLEERRPALGAFLFALAVSIKMSPALLGVWFLYRRKWKFLSFAAVWFALFVLLTLPFDGLRHWRDFFGILPDISRGDRMIRGLIPADAPGNLSIKGLVYRLTPYGTKWLDQASALLAFGLLVVALLREKRTKSLGPIRPHNGWLLYRLSILTLLASPMTWYNHYILLLPAAAVLVFFIVQSEFSISVKAATVGVFFGATLPFANWWQTTPEAGWLAFGLLNSWSVLGLLLLFFWPDLLVFMRRRR